MPSHRHDMIWFSRSTSPPPAVQHLFGRDPRLIVVDHR
jgi:hypothetical protein